MYTSSIQVMDVEKELLDAPEVVVEPTVSALLTLKH